jgi:adenine phosphoribosyltransferase
MDIAQYIRDIPDFPKKGIIFKDITPLLQEPEAFRYVIDQFYEHYKEMGADVIISAESRGFIFGAVLAYKLGCSFVPVRKPGKLPYKTISCSYEKEYGTDTLCMHEDAIKPGQKVIIIDDLLATGGTAKAMVEMVDKAGGQMFEAGFMIELDFLKGRELLGSLPIYSMLHY